MKPKHSMSKLELLGAVFIVLCGTPLHFFNDWVGSPSLAWIGPVNESTWEHFKLAFWPAIVWAYVEWRQMPGFRRTLWTAKLVAIVTSMLTVTVVFYGYTAMLGHHVLAFDIATFVVAVALGQWSGYKAWNRGLHWSLAPWAVAAIAASFVLFSYAPPDGFLFQIPAATD